MKKAPDEASIPFIGMLRHLSQLLAILKLAQICKRSAWPPKKKAL
jgi:hypothetical protein